MLWINNIVPFSSTQPEISEKKNLNWNEIPKVKKNKEYFFQVCVTDNEMYDRYLKNDLITVKIQNFCSNNSDAIVVLPDHSICLKKYNYENHKVLLSNLNPFNHDLKSYDKAEVTILGVPTSIVRMN